MIRGLIGAAICIAAFIAFGLAVQYGLLAFTLYQELTR